MAAVATTMVTLLTQGLAQGPGLPRFCSSSSKKWSGCSIRCCCCCCKRNDNRGSTHIGCRHSSIHLTLLFMKWMMGFGSCWRHWRAPAGRGPRLPSSSLACGARSYQGSFEYNNMVLIVLVVSMVVVVAVVVVVVVVVVLLVVVVVIMLLLLMIKQY